MQTRNYEQRARDYEHMVGTTVEVQHGDGLGSNGAVRGTLLRVDWRGFVVQTRKRRNPHHLTGGEKLEVDVPIYVPWSRVERVDTPAR